MRYLLISILFWPALLSAGDLSGFIAGEVRYFPRSPLYTGQYDVQASIALQPEYYFDWADGSQRLLIVPFARLDSGDDERTHVDIRELYWEWIGDWLEARIGIRKIFWGVTESVHLVDIINQSDLVENLDNEQKLGQAMLNLDIIRDWGILELFLMSGFRQRTFPGSDGRLRFPLVVDSDRAHFEANAEEWNPDVAVRWSYTLGDVDLGLSAFTGTGREPRFETSMSSGDPVLVPVYELINQAGVELQYTRGGWLWKLEAISRQRNSRQMTAAVAGFEFTIGNISNKGIDLGLIAEYLYDDRDSRYFAPTFFNDDIFVGARLALNDVQSSELLMGGIVDRENGSTFFNVEASRRFGDRYKLNLEMRAFLNADANDPLYGFRQDSYLRFELARYF